MQFRVDPTIFETFEGLHIGVLVVRDCDNTVKSPEIAQQLRDAEAFVRALPDIEPVNSYPPIHAWREAHRKFGNSPKKNAPSVQALVRRVVKGGELPSINALVDLYNAMSLKYVITAGGEDIDTCEGDIQLRFADGTEEFIELGSTENNPPLEGEVIYADDKGVICRRFNWREGDRTKLTDETKNGVLVLEGLPPITPEQLRSALNELSTLVKRFCRGDIAQHILSSEKPSATI